MKKECIYARHRAAPFSCNIAYWSTWLVLPFFYSSKNTSKLRVRNFEFSRKFSLFSKKIILNLVLMHCLSRIPKLLLELIDVVSFRFYCRLNWTAVIPQIENTIQKFSFVLYISSVFCQLLFYSIFCQIFYLSSVLITSLTYHLVISYFVPVFCQLSFYSIFCQLYHFSFVFKTSLTYHLPLVNSYFFPVFCQLSVLFNLLSTPSLIICLHNRSHLSFSQL